MPLKVAIVAYGGVWDRDAGSSEDVAFTLDASGHTTPHLEGTEPNIHHIIETSADKLEQADWGKNKGLCNNQDH